MTDDSLIDVWERLALFGGLATVIVGTTAPGALAMADLRSGVPLDLHHQTALRLGPPRRRGGDLANDELLNGRDRVADLGELLFAHAAPEDGLTDEP